MPKQLDDDELRRIIDAAEDEQELTADEIVNEALSK